MTAKQEAAAMVLSFLGIVGNNMKYAKECALVAVNKIIESRKEDRNFDDTLSSYSEYWSPHPMYLTYWLQVKQEIEAI
jgi:hypothetical protein